MKEGGPAARRDWGIFEIDQELISNNVEVALNYLERNFGVQDLQTAEGVRLRQLVEECLRESREYNEARKKGEVTGDNRFAFHEEATARWFRELYDMRFEDIPFVVVVKDGNTGESFIVRTSYGESRDTFDIGRIGKEAEAKGIASSSTIQQEIKSLPLYANDILGANLRKLGKKKNR